MGGHLLAAGHPLAAGGCHSAGFLLAATACHQMAGSCWRMAVGRHSCGLGWGVGASHINYAGWGGGGLS